MVPTTLVSATRRGWRRCPEHRRGAAPARSSTWAFSRVSGRLPVWAVFRTRPVSGSSGMTSRSVTATD